jgi:hypothetical protein
VAVGVLLVLVLALTSASKPILAGGISDQDVSEQVTSDDPELAKTKITINLKNTLGKIPGTRLVFRSEIRDMTVQSQCIFIVPLKAKTNFENSGHGLCITA